MGEDGTEITTPANSEPEIQGRGGWCSAMVGELAIGSCMSLQNGRGLFWNALRMYARYLSGLGNKITRAVGAAILTIFAGDLKEIEEVGCRGVDSHHILVFCRNRVGELCDLEIHRALSIDVRYATVVGKRLVE